MLSILVRDLRATGMLCPLVCTDTLLGGALESRSKSGGNGDVERICPKGEGGRGMGRTFGDLGVVGEGGAIKPSDAFLLRPRLKTDLKRDFRGGFTEADLADGSCVSPRPIMKGRVRWCWQVIIL